MEGQLKATKGGGDDERKKTYKRKGSWVGEMIDIDSKATWLEKKNVPRRLSCFWSFFSIWKKEYKIGGEIRGLGENRRMLEGELV